MKVFRQIIRIAHVQARSFRTYSSLYSQLIPTKGATQIYRVNMLRMAEIHKAARRFMPIAGSLIIKPLRDLTVGLAQDIFYSGLQIMPPGNGSYIIQLSRMLIGLRPVRVPLQEIRVIRGTRYPHPVLIIIRIIGETIRQSQQLPLTPCLMLVVGIHLHGAEDRLILAKTIVSINQVSVHVTHLHAQIRELFLTLAEQIGVHANQVHRVDLESSLQISPVHLLPFPMLPDLGEVTVSVIR